MKLSSLLCDLRRLALICGLSLVGSTAPSDARERPIMVDIDYARVVKIPAGAQTLIIGNPLVADVTMLKNNQLMVITGKSFGTTNLIVLDGSGQQVGESMITVVPANDKLIVMRGPHRESYACNPDCVPAIDLGDDHAYMGEVIGAIKSHDGSLGAGKQH